MIVEGNQKNTGSRKSSRALPALRITFAYYFFLNAAQRRRAAAAIFSRASGLRVRLPDFALEAGEDVAGFATDAPRLLAQRARCAAAMRSRASGDIVRFPLAAGFLAETLAAFATGAAETAG